MTDKDLTTNHIVYSPAYMVMAQQGGPAGGFSMYGPFSTESAASRWARGEFSVDVHISIEPIFHVTLHGDPK